ncbi:hypothetical protein GWI33_014967 [Rhynchophorus ferrugineus]|uniref:Uncharacterized protein n=1 Tax=Rhynchophorus ferrugineus TaxID=354439 RepID=A0A834M4Y8_RHYFE|nr:hypothetical protein GWI33_014967 [Rhynchophorus ferrugineus]
MAHQAGIIPAQCRNVSNNTKPPPSQLRLLAIPPRLRGFPRVSRRPEPDVWRGEGRRPWDDRSLSKKRLPEPEGSAERLKTSPRLIMVPVKIAPWS